MFRHAFIDYSTLYNKLLNKLPLLLAAVVYQGRVSIEYARGVPSGSPSSSISYLLVELASLCTRSLIVFQMTVFLVGCVLVTVCIVTGLLLLLPLVLFQHLVHHSALDHQLVLKLSLLSLGQLRQLLNNILPVFQTKSPDYFPSLAVPFGFGHVVVLISHVHVSCCVGGVLFATIVEAGEFFLQLFGAPANVLFSQGFSLALVARQVVLHFQILNQ